MKNLRQNYILVCISFVLFAIISGCTDEEANPYYSDAFLVNLDTYISHPSPTTGLAYTEEQRNQLSYDPLVEESYLEGQNVDLTLVTATQPTEVRVVGEDGTVLETITEFSSADSGFQSKSFSRSLQDLGLLEIGDQIKLEFKITYPDGPPVSESFTVKRTGIVEGPASFLTFLKRSSGETVGLATTQDVTAIEDDPNRGTVVTFDGADDFLAVQDTVDLSFKNTGDFSVGLWVNTTSTNDDPSIISDKDWGSGGNPGFVLSFTGGTWKLNAADGTNRIDINDLGPINDGTWHFLTVTFDRDGNATAFQDGIEVGSTDMSILGDMASGLPLYLGQDGTGNYGVWFEGMLGQAFLYDYALSAAEVAEFYGGELPTGAQFRKANGAFESIPVTAGGGTVSSVEEGRSAFTLDGVDDSVLWDSTADLSFKDTGDFSIGIWVNTTSANDDPSIISDKDWGSGGNPGFVLSFTGGTWKLNAADGTERIDINGLGPINDGSWHFLTVTFDRDGNATVYQDGIEVGSTDMSILGDMASGLPIYLGQDGTGNYGVWFEGQLANSVIFDYVLTAEQVAALYNQ